MASKIVTISLDDDGIELHEKAVSKKRGLTSELYKQALKNYFGKEFDVQKLQRQVKIAEENIKTEQLSLKNLRQQMRNITKINQEQVERSEATFLMEQQKNEDELEKNAWKRRFADFGISKNKEMQKELRQIFEQFYKLPVEERKIRSKNKKNKEINSYHFVLNYALENGFEWDGEKLIKKTKKEVKST